MMFELRLEGWAAVSKKRVCVHVPDRGSSRSERYAGEETKDVGVRSHF